MTMDLLKKWTIDFIQPFIHLLKDKKKNVAVGGSSWTWRGVREREAAARDLDVRDDTGRWIMIQDDDSTMMEVRKRMKTILHFLVTRHQRRISLKLNLKKMDKVFGGGTFAD